MKREIKFRGYDPDTKRWYFGSLVKQNKTTYVTSEDYDQNPSNTEWFIFWDEMTDWCLPNRHIQGSVDPDSIGEYTGLKDKNGREIYEGDVLECISFTYGNGETETDNFLVQYHEVSAGFIAGPYTLWKLMDIRKCKVVGNVHQNPELLEVDK